MVHIKALILTYIVQLKKQKQKNFRQDEYSAT